MAAAADAAESRLKEIMDYALAEEEKLLQKTFSTVLEPQKPGKTGGSLYFKHYWKKQNASLEQPRRFK